ncbi:MAG: hypothetical protein CMO81_02280 [Waddliaceae bacterium]|nr:hypothetical protein [Waddliaceae bacterium]|tara:strand:- start:28 stop:495 length:468 start_codon:yes stop_codon:yes gene_type:complete
MLVKPKTIVWRHRKENLKKCSLRGLESQAGFAFFSYPNQTLPDLDGYILLTIDAPVLTKDDGDKGLLLLDGTWRYAEKMYKALPPSAKLIHRSLPPELRTAYPRKQDDCSEPERGLASVEALYAAYFLMGRSTGGLLDHYHWRDAFLEINKGIFT